MPRHARIMVAGATVHIVHRGNNRQECFHSAEDRAFYLFHLGRMLPRTGCALHAYVLMGNHLHLLLTTREAHGCAMLMKSVAQLYAQYVNKAYRRSGYVWEGRCKSCLVQSEQYVLACYRYIELNPVRAGIVAAPGHYTWSSFRANAHGERSSLVTPHDEYRALGRTGGDCQATYRDLFGSQGGPANVEEIRRATRSGYVLGDISFKNQVARVLGRQVEARPAGRRPSAKRQDGQGDLHAEQDNGAEMVVRP
jgi:putative transposase